MDTISRESNNSYLPVAAGLVGLVAIILGIAALAKVSSLSKKVPDDLQDRLTAVESNATGAASAADKASKDIISLTHSTQAAFDSIGPEIGELKDSMQKLQEAAKTRVAPAKAGKGGAGAATVAAGPGEYKVKPGDTGTKIARATGVSISQLESLNPGVNWRRLRVGQIIKTK